MKKIILSGLMIAIMIITMCSCGGNNEIELNLDNYSDYLDVFVSPYNAGEELHYTIENGIWITPDVMAAIMYDSIGLTAKVSATSTNFNYNDVAVTVKVKGNYGCYESLNGDGVEYTYDYERELTVNTNIAGNGSSKDIIKLADNLVTRNDLVSVEYEIVKISGTVTPAN